MHAEPRHRPAIAVAGDGRMLEIDALRGVAAMLVVAFHYLYRYHTLFGHEGSVGAAAGWTRIGYYGVHLFFIISGLVILMTIDRARSVGEFLFHRVARLYPAFWVACGLTFAVVALAGLPGRQASWREALVNLTMIPSALGATPIDGVYWSLKVEWIFYAVISVVVGLGARRHLNLVMLLLVGLDLVGLSVGRHFCLFFLGMLFYQSRAAWTRERAALAAVCLADLWMIYALRPALAAPAGAEPFAGTLVAGVLTAFALAVGVCSRWAVPGVGNPVLVFLGAISYSLYLVHQNLGYVLIRWGIGQGLGGWWAIAAALSLVIGLAAAMTYLVERPANSALRRWWKRRAVAAQAPGAAVPAVAPPVVVTPSSAPAAPAGSTCS